MAPAGAVHPHRMRSPVPGRSDSEDVVPVADRPSWRGVEMVFAEWQVGQVVWALMWFTLVGLWVWLVISLFVDVFRSKELSGWLKALWTLLFLLVPILGVVAYLIVRGPTIAGNMIDEREADMAAQNYMRVR
jgi:hypothetical protein